MSFVVTLHCRSGTGKSTLLKHLVKSLSVSSSVKKLHLLNVGGAEKSVYAKYFGSSRVKSLETFENLSQTSRKALILVEDIISISKSDEQLLRQSLNYEAHHKQQKIFCVSHSIYKTSIWSLLSFFHFIIFTSSPSNVPVLRFTLNYFKVDKNQLGSWIKKFTELGNNGQHGIYFYFDCLQMTFNVSENTAFTKLKLMGTLGTADTVGNLETSAAETLQLKFNQLVSGFELATQAASVFNIIVNCIDRSLIRERDLTFAFKSVKPGLKEIRVSLVDYVTALLTTELHVSEPLKVFHTYAKSLCSVPQIFCKNKFISK